MAEREHGEEAVGRVSREVLTDGPDIRGQVSMGQHDPLGVAGGAGGEHHLCEVACRKLHRTRLRQVVGLALHILEVDLRDTEGLVRVGREPGDEGRRGPGAGGDILGEVVGAAQVEGHGHGAGAEGTEEGEHPVGAVGGPDEHPVALSDAALL